MSMEGREFIEALEGFWFQVRQEERGILRRWDITPLQGIVLRMSLCEEPLTMSVLAARLGIRPQTATHLVDFMEERGWIRRTRSRDDRRVSLLEPTVRGRKASEAIHQAFMDRMETFLSAAPKDQLKAGAAALRAAQESFRQARAHPAGGPRSARSRRIRQVP